MRAIRSTLRSHRVTRMLRLPSPHAGRPISPQPPDPPPPRPPTPNHPQLEAGRGVGVGGPKEESAGGGGGGLLGHQVDLVLVAGVQLQAPPRQALHPPVPARRTRVRGPGARGASHSPPRPAAQRPGGPAARRSAVVPGSFVYAPPPPKSIARQRLGSGIRTPPPSPGVGCVCGSDPGASSTTPPPLPPPSIPPFNPTHH